MGFSDSSYTIKANGEVWAWGYNGLGQLGDNTRASKSSPVLVVGSHTFATLCSLYLHNTVGSTCWGHVTGVTETNKNALLGNWIGAGGTVTGTGDSEKITMTVGGGPVISEVIETGAVLVTLKNNSYT